MSRVAIQPPISQMTIPALIPVMLIDYVFVICLYGSIAFWLAVVIDGHVLPKYDPVATAKKSSLRLYLEVLLQIALQGFLAIVINTMLQKIPSPVQGVAGYNARSPEGAVIRNPAILTVLLFALSKSMQGRLSILFARFDKNE